MPGIASAEVTIASEADRTAAVSADTLVYDNDKNTYYLSNTAGTELTINGGDYTDAAMYARYIGDMTSTEDISGYTLTITANAGTFDVLLAAGYTMGRGNVTNNQVIINGGTLNKELFGGYTRTIGNANYNKVTITGGAISNIITGGRSYSGTANYNEVTVTGGASSNNITGGYSVSGDANYNKVTVTGGASSDINGGQSSSGNVHYNEVSITGGKPSGLIYGGLTYEGNVTNNTVTIAGTADTSGNPSVYGGQVSVSGQATDNTVNLLTKVTLSTLTGGFSSSGSCTGNTLNVAATGNTANVLRGFQNLNFYLPANITTTDTMLTVTNTAQVDGATVGVLAQGTLSSLTPGDTVNLLTAGTLTGTITPGTIASATIPTSITTVDTYNFTINQTTNSITATLNSTTSDSGNTNSGTTNNGNSNSGSSASGTASSGSSTSSSSSSPNSNTVDTAAAERHANTKSMVETRAATTTMLNAGADMLADKGFQQAANAVALAVAEASATQETSDSASQQDILPAHVVGFTPYATIGGGSLRAESGSHVDSKSWGINVGFVREIQNKAGKLLFGPLVEYGRGSYDSYLDNGTHGDGKSSFWGLGAMARQVNHDGLYYEGSLRAGRVKSDYRGNVNTLNVNYDSGSNYIAAHIGIGKVTKLSAQNSLDYYLKYFYARQAGDTVTMHATGVPDQTYNFDAINSHRLRLGTRLTHKTNEKSSLYAGIACQYEFDGEARASYNGNNTPAPSIKGASGMAEIGWQIKPSQSPLTLDLGLTGWLGKQRGLTAQLGMLWKF